MTVSKLLIQNSVETPTRRIPLKISWKSAALFGLPLAVAGIAGISYYVYKRRQSSCLETEQVPKTPLESAVALKNRGNKFFKAGQYAKAIQLYNEGLDVCPEDAVQERAALYQNRAAAKENLRQYASAVSDCSSALQLSPRYLKALNRRAHLYEKLEQLENCLPDVVACCIFEEFKNPDNIISMDQTLKKIGQQKAKNEWSSVSHTLPAAAFIRNYLSAFAWDPFSNTAPAEDKIPVVNGSPPDESTLNEDQHTADEPAEPSTVSAIEGPFSEAFAILDKALTTLSNGDYEASRDHASRTVSLFEAVLSNQSKPPEPSKPIGDVAESTDSPQPDATNISDGVDSGVAVDYQTAPTASQLTQAKAGYMKAKLLYGTFMALSGMAAEAKQLFQSVFAENSGAETIVRVNALIKSACLSMSVDQDLAACLLDFQTAQNVCPECPDVYLHRGQINLLADQLDEALHDLNTAVKLKPEFSIAQAQRLYTMYRKALSESNSDRASSKVQEFRRLTQKYPSCLETHSLFAQVLTERGEFSSSDEEFAKVIELAPDSGLAYAHRGILQLRWKQDREAAQKWFDLGAKADPKCELIHELLGQLAVEQGEFQSALNHFSLAIREAKTQNDLAHLIALREGVNAQHEICKKYNISVSDVVSNLRREQQQMMMMGMG